MSPHLDSNPNLCIGLMQIAVKTRKILRIQFTFEYFVQAKICGRVGVFAVQMSWVLRQVFVHSVFSLLAQLHFKILVEAPYDRNWI